MSNSVQDIVTRLVRFERAPKSTATAFRRLMHDKDLLPRLQVQLETILEAYGKFQPIVYDTQGIKDEGTDIAIRLGTDGAQKSEVVSFQVKSFGDLEEGGYLQRLKAQRFESSNIKGLSKCFILLCTDPIMHKPKIRMIEAAFKTAARTEIIEPEFAFTFLYMPKTRIEAMVKRTLEGEDYVFKTALSSLDYDSSTAKALAVFLCTRFVFKGASTINFSELFDSSALRRMYGELRIKRAALLEQILENTDDAPFKLEELGLNDEELSKADWEDDDEQETPVEIEEFASQLVADIAVLENDILDSQGTDQSYILLTNQMRPLSAVALDALVRYRYNEEQLHSYMFDTMGVRD